MKVLSAFAVVAASSMCIAAPPQYSYQKISIPGASKTEKKREAVSVSAAESYIEQGNKAWSSARKCIACHTNGSYLAIRPALTKQLGPPAQESREFFVSRLQVKLKANPRTLMSGLRPTQIAYIAAGLAEWDRHVTGKLSKETDQALRLMLKVQAKNGSWSNLDCWPPHESSAWHGATVAAMAIATAPGWLKGLDEEKDALFIKRIAKLKKYLQTAAPAHDYARVLLLWTATRTPGLIDKQKQRELMRMILEHQRTDGGWSIRTFSTPEKWGRGNRAKKLRAEPEFKTLPSDGHMTGLAVIVLRDAGMKANDPRIQRAVAWIKANQRESGRWWTRSLNTDSYHFITYSGTLYPLAALAKCNALPKTK